MKFKHSDHSDLLRRLSPPQGKIDMVLDTDTYNEVDDQFALAYALASPDKLNVKAIYAAPFHNDRSNGPEDGMYRSYDEIIRLTKMLKTPFEGSIYRGSKHFLTNEDTPEESEAVKDLISRSQKYSPENPLYVVAIAAITNIASAILIDPTITDRIVIVWLGGNPLYWRDTHEFNLFQDIAASRIIFDCGVPVIQLPCRGVTSHMLTTLEDLKFHIGGKSELCDALIELYSGYRENHFGYAKELFDVAAVAWLINSKWAPSLIVPSPIVSYEGNWSCDQTRHPIRTVEYVERNPIFADMYSKITTI